MTSTHSLGTEVPGGNQAADAQRTDGAPTCPECGGSVRVARRESVCEDCGLVLDEHQLDHGPEWRSFADDETDSKRTGAPLTERHHDRGLSTMVGRYRDGQGNELSRATRRKFGRLRRQHRQATWGSKTNWTLGHGFTEIERIGGALGLSESVLEQASALLRSAQNDGLLLGWSIEAMAAASVFGACRCSGLARTLAEIVEVAQVERGRVANAYDVLNEHLGLATLCQRPTDFVPRIATATDAPDEVRHRALELADFAEESGIANGRSPSGIAAACLYRASEGHYWPVTQGEIADAANTSRPTVQVRNAELRDALQE